MPKFYDALKDILIQNLPQYACEYYHTALQHQDKLQELIDLCEKHEFGFYYYEPEEDEYYGQGQINVWFDGDFGDKLPEFNYKLNLSWDQRHWGYCECEPTDKFYNPEHKCCGMGCDASFAEITLVKSKDTVFSFNSQKRDLWALQAQWNGQGKDEYERKQKEAQLENLNKMIEELVETQNKLQLEILKGEKFSI